MLLFGQMLSINIRLIVTGTLIFIVPNPLALSFLREKIRVCYVTFLHPS